MKKWLKIALPSIVIISVITLVVIYPMFTGFMDGDASHGVLATEQTSDQEITFTITGDVHDWYGGPVKFTDCAYGLMVDNKTISSDDYVARGNNNGTYFYINYTKVRGAGISYSTIDVDADNEIFYIVIFKDVDMDGYLSSDDRIIIKSTAPFDVDTEYRFFLATDINDDAMYPNYLGVLNGLLPSGYGGIG
jgi:hypothetical protein